MPNGISHHQKPAFNARWFSGDIKPPENSRDSFLYEGSGGNDKLLIYGIEWQDETPDQEQFNVLMDEAITAIDNWISERF